MAWLSTLSKRIPRQPFVISVVLFYNLCGILNAPLFYYFNMHNSLRGVIGLLLLSNITWGLIWAGQTVWASVWVVVVGVIAVTYFYISTHFLTEVLMVLLPITFLPAILLRKQPLKWILIVSLFPIIMGIFFMSLHPWQNVLVKWGLIDIIYPNMKTSLQLAATGSSFFLVFFFALTFSRIFTFLLEEARKANQQLAEKNHQLLEKKVALETNLMIVENQKQIIQTQVAFLEDARLEMTGEPKRQATKRLLEPKMSATRFGYNFEHAFIPSPSAEIMVFFDYFPVSHEKLAIAIANVTGSIQNPSLALVAFKGLLHRVISSTIAPSESIGELNRYVVASRVLEHHIPLLYGVIDVAKHQFTYVNAGYDGGYMIRKTGHTLLKGEEVPIGHNANTVFRNRTIQFSEGDRMVFLSHHLAMMQNSQGEAMGHGRLLDLLQYELSKDLVDFVGTVEKKIVNYLDHAQQVEDLLVLSVSRIPASEQTWKKELTVDKE